MAVHVNKSNQRQENNYTPHTIDKQRYRKEDDIANFDHGANYRASGVRTENKLSNCTRLLINSGVQIVVGVAGIYYLVDMKPLDEW